MKKYLHILLAAILLVMAQFSVAQELFSPAHTAPKYEVRAVWLTTLMGLDWPKTKATSAVQREQQKQELCQILDQLKAARINTILLQTRIRGSVIFRYLPQQDRAVGCLPYRTVRQRPGVRSAGICHRGNTPPRHGTARLGGNSTMF